MGSALAAGVSGLKAHQAMLDVAGNNLANVNTTGYKNSSVTFSELLSQTIKGASGSSENLGGTNPQQFGSGVEVSGIRRNLSQGNIVSTGQDLDMAIDGSGYFVLNNGRQDVFTRSGSFGIDENNTLVDPTTGYKVQRIGTYGENEGFQSLGDSSIHIPWDASMPASSTSNIALNGNLRSSSDADDAVTQLLAANTIFSTASGGSAATLNSFMADLDQWGGSPLGVGDTGTILISGTREDGTVFTNQPVTWTGAPVGFGATVQDVMDQITALYDDSSASLNAEGKIILTANDGGYNLSQVTGMTYSPAGGEALELPTYFDYTRIGGNDDKNFKITVFDNMGEQHSLTGVFVKGDTTNTWDLVIKSVTGEREADWTTYDIHNSTAMNRRISGIEFNTDGSFKGLNSTSERAEFSVQFENNPSVLQTITLDLGTPGEFTGLTQFSGKQSSAAALTQNGYEAGSLSSISIDQSGIVVGSFTNGVKVNVAALQMGTFLNPEGMEAAGGGYFLSTANSGEPIATMASTGATGSIRGKSLEKSNVDIATEFVNLMQAQNGYQANARTITVANDILRELTNLIR